MAKKKHEHHGGAWKVAYADFVTAMMALFMVLWISAQDDEILIATSQYFASPFNAPLDRSFGVMDGQGMSSPESISKGEEARSSMVDMAMMHSLASEFYRMLNIEESESDKEIEVQVTSDGLRIIAYDRSKQPIFAYASDAFTDWGALVMQNLAWLLDRYDMRVRVDTHTVSRFDGENEDYGPWELAMDRSNAVRRALVHYALTPEKIEMLTAYADVNPLSEDDKNSQRIELSLSTNVQ